MFAELNGRIQDRDKEVKQLQDALRGKGAGDTAALMQELSEARDALGHKNSEIELLQKQLQRAEESAASSGNSSELEKRIQDLEAELKSKKEQCESLIRNGGGGGAGGADMAKMQEICRNFDNVVGMCNADYNAMRTHITDLQKIFVAYVKIDINHLQGQEKTRLENALKVNDPKALFEEISKALKSSKTTLGSLTDTVQNMRSALQ
jgi:DNA repair exonuclease SbcCD ATPase subunit